jgi:hypothetical protein
VSSRMDNGLGEDVSLGIDSGQGEGGLGENFPWEGDVSLWDGQWLGKGGLGEKTFPREKRCP